MENRNLMQVRDDLKNKLNSKNILLKKEKGRIFREKDEATTIGQLKKRVCDLQDEGLKNKKFMDSQVKRLKTENDALKVSVERLKKDTDGKSSLVDRYKSRLEVTCSK